jgi:hypothetical protein
MPRHPQLEHLRNGSDNRQKAGERKTLSGTELTLIVVLAPVALLGGWKGFMWVCHKSAEQELQIQKSFYDQAKVRRRPQQKETKVEKKPIFIPNSKLRNPEIKKR